MHTPKPVKQHRAFYMALFASVFLAAAIWRMPAYLTFNFGHVTFNQVLFYIVTEDGTVGTDPLILESALDMLGLQPLGMAIAAMVLTYSLTQLYRHLVRHRPLLPPKRVLSATLAGGLLAALPMVAAYNTLQDMGGLDFFANHAGPDHFSTLYIKQPATLPNLPVTGPTGSTPRPRNLILLYVESLETTFSDERYFPGDLNAPLKAVFDRKPFAIKEMAGTNWTMAGMLASQCGVPLATFIWNKAEFKPGAMLGKATCLGDYLSKLGYEQRFFVGPELKFAGMDKFYLNHGFQQATGKSEWLAAGMPAEKLTGWGSSINDDSLLDFALIDILALHSAYRATGRPFNVTIITTDNHAPHGYLSPRCPASNRTPAFARVIECTNQVVATFYETLKQASVLQDTVFVVMGDHLFMNTPQQDHQFPPRETRRVFFNFRSPGNDVCAFDADEVTHFDVAPTLLGLLTGSNIQQMGLGDNLCQTMDLQTKRSRNTMMQEDIASHSKTYRALW